MTPDFWRLIADTRPAEWNPSAHAAAITSALVEAGTEESLRFVAAFDEAIDAIYTWDLWGAAYLSFGGCSDDAFEYLRAWIIGAGESAWAEARREPERLFIDLLDDADDPDMRWEALGIHDGESLLFAAGVAYERLTGEWPARGPRIRPSEPAGGEWEEDQLPERFPQLFAALPHGHWGEEDSSDDDLTVMNQVERGIDAFSGGEHGAAGNLLDPIVDDPDEWSLVPADRKIDVAYIVGIGRLMSGDVDGAATALRRVESSLGEVDYVRRALAQVELARGDLDRAGHWIDDSEEASRADRVLAAKLAWRRGDREGALSRAIAEMANSVEPDEHPWDVAGSAHQLGQIFADAGDEYNAVLAAGVMARLLEDAPKDLPLLIHLQLLAGAIARLQGQPRDALRKLRRLRTRLMGTDLAECLREQARAQTALGRDGEAAASYRAAAEEFDRAGERWEAGATREESWL